MQNIIKKNQFMSTPVIVLPNDTDPNEKKYEAWQTLRDSGMTCTEIAKMFNVGKSTVYQKTVTHEDLRKYARGSVAACNARKAYYIPIMLELRKLGYSNVEIGKKTGFDYDTVLKYIGNQPDETTLASMRVAGAKRRFRNIARKNQITRDNNEPIPAVAKILESA